ncbi:MAG: Gfo/Idh/MocA family oxidoreductase [Bacteroidales bacterium]
MNSEKSIIGFIGAGGIARSHAFALSSLPFYYNDFPAAEKESVCSFSEESRRHFAVRFGFNRSQSLAEFAKNERINSVYVLGPNRVHFEHLKIALEMPSVTRVYLEKPVCSTADEESMILELAAKHHDKKIQVGFQYLFCPAVKGAIDLVKSGRLGKPVHFDFKYYHGDYLRQIYRSKRATRLTPAPDGGAMADLGSHVVSMLIAFLGDGIEITGAIQAGSFPDVPAGSDLFSLINLYDTVTGAAGTLSSSRISSGAGDFISFEIYAEKGTVKYSTLAPDSFEYFLEETGLWNCRFSGSDYQPHTSFPSGHVPAGWLRPMIHAHYIFLTGATPDSFAPDISHGLSVQRIVRQTADHLERFRRYQGF